MGREGSIFKGLHVIAIIQFRSGTNLRQWGHTSSQPREIMIEYVHPETLRRTTFDNCFVPLDLLVLWDASRAVVCTFSWPKRD